MKSATMLHPCRWLALPCAVTPIEITGPNSSGVARPLTVAILLVSALLLCFCVFAIACAVLCAFSVQLFMSCFQRSIVQNASTFMYMRMWNFHCDTMDNHSNVD